MSVSTMLQSRRKRWYHTLQHFSRGPLNTLMISLFEVVNIGRTYFAYFDFDVAAKKAVSCYKIRQPGRPGVPVTFKVTGNLNTSFAANRLFLTDHLHAQQC
jgi:hypothetical protein